MNHTAFALIFLLASVFFQTNTSSARSADRPGLQDNSVLNDDDVNVLKMALREAYQRELVEMEAIESQLERQIESLQQRKQEMTKRKRNHVQCMVNVVSCYRKRK